MAWAAARAEAEGTRADLCHSFLRPLRETAVAKGVAVGRLGLGRGLGNWALSSLRPLPLRVPGAAPESAISQTLRGLVLRNSQSPQGQNSAPVRWLNVALLDFCKRLLYPDALAPPSTSLPVLYSYIKAVVTLCHQVTAPRSSIIVSMKLFGENAPARSSQSASHSAGKRAGRAEVVLEALSLVGCVGRTESAEQQQNRREDETEDE